MTLGPLIHNPLEIERLAKNFNVKYIDSINIQKSPNSDEEDLKEDLKKDNSLYSKWLSPQKIPLTIVATAYVDLDAPKAKELYYITKLCKKISEDKTILGDVASNFSTITYKPYKGEYIQKYSASYRYRFAPKDTLSDVLTPDEEKNEAEVLIRLNYSKLKKELVSARLISLKLCEP